LILREKELEKREEKECRNRHHIGADEIAYALA
jgi:hypothetical protein